MNWILVIDFAMMVLIWMVQLLIYPGFKYYEREKFIIWHHKYTRNMGFIVAPLMLVQLALHLYFTYFYFNWMQLLSFVLIVLVWLLTFLIFVPIHQKISFGNYHKKDLIKLVRLNWFRTAIWSLIFLLNF